MPHGAFRAGRRIRLTKGNKGNEVPFVAFCYFLLRSAMPGATPGLFDIATLNQEVKSNALDPGRPSLCNGQPRTLEIVKIIALILEQKPVVQYVKGVWAI